MGKKVQSITLEALLSGTSAKDQLKNIRDQEDRLEYAYELLDLAVQDLRHKQALLESTLAGFDRIKASLDNISVRRQVLSYTGRLRNDVWWREFDKDAEEQERSQQWFEQNEY